MRMLRRLRAAAVLALVFVWDLFAASLAVARIVLSPRIVTRPAILAVPVALEAPWAIALFAYFTSLTPGSTCLHVDAEARLLYLHVLDAPDRDATAARLKRLYEDRIRELER